MEEQKQVSQVGTGEHRDGLFAGTSYPAPFAFNDDVARVFDDMAARSIPMYREATSAAVTWALDYYQDGSWIYDLGCSTGTTMTALATAFAAEGRRTRIAGIDPSLPMLERAAAKLAPWQGQHDISLSPVEAQDAECQDASVIIANYTLQFIAPDLRRILMKRLYAALRPGGILFLSDKVAASSPALHASITQTYERYKASQGYSQEEIARKKAALEGVLIPLSFREQMDLVGDAGFAYYEPILKWNNFLSIIALKR